MGSTIVSGPSLVYVGKYLDRSKILVQDTGLVQEPSELVSGFVVVANMFLSSLFN